MTAIIYFGEMLVASVLAIVLLAISRLPMSSEAALFAGGIVAWTRITVPINYRHHCSSTTKAIIDLQLEITASAQRCGITYSGRCCAEASCQKSLGFTRRLKRVLLRLASQAP